LTQHPSSTTESYDDFLRDLKERIRVAQITDAYLDKEFVQQVVAQIPWGHKARISDVISDRAKREWYTHRAIAHGSAYKMLRLTNVV
jgi:DUF1016 N-terminal domain